MALTLPADISNNKDKISIKPLLLIEFPDLGTPLYLGSQAYVLDHGGAGEKTYQDVLKRGNLLSLQWTIPQLLNDFNSLGRLTINVLDFVGTYRASLLGTSPDLTNETVNVYIKLDTSSDLKTDAIQIFTGIVSDYHIRRDVLTINCKSEIPILTDIPVDLLPNQTKWAKALQYGDFNWDDDPRWWGDRYHRFMPCPLVSWDDVSYVARYWIADHAMENLPASISTSYYDAYSFVLRDNHFLHVMYPAAATFTNNAAGSYVDVAHTAGMPGTGAAAYLFLPPTANGGSNAADHASNSYDGKAATYASVEPGFDPLHVAGPYGFDDLVDCELYSTPGVAAYIYFGGLDGTGTDDFYITISDGVNSVTTYFDTSYADGWHAFPFPSACNTLQEIEDYTIEIGLYTNGITMYVKNILVRARMQDVTDDDEFLYLRAKGREYSGTWNSRKTSGNLITNVADVIESLLRDEWSYGDSDIDMDSFDEVYTHLGTTVPIECAGSFLERKAGDDYLQEILNMFNLALIYTSDQKWRLVHPIAACHVFTQSGTGTPGDEDIFTDSDTLTAGEYSQHPIRLEGFELRRTNVGERYEKLLINYISTPDGDYLRSTSTGSGKTVTIDNWMLSGDTSNPGNLLGDLDDWLLTQKFIATVKTFYNALAIQQGDIINIRHTELNDDILDATVNTQKWMVGDIHISWRPNIFTISAIELK